MFLNDLSELTHEIVKMFDFVDLLSSKDVVFLSIMFSDASFTPTDRQQVNTDKLFFFFFFKFTVIECLKQNPCDKILLKLNLGLLNTVNKWLFFLTFHLIVPNWSNDQHCCASVLFYISNDDSIFTAGATSWHLTPKQKR